MATFNFTKAKYQLDTGNGGGIVAVKYYSTRASSLNPTAITGATNIPGSANARFGGRKRLGIHCRGVVLTKSNGTAPNVRIDRAFVPILSPTDYASATVGTVISSGALSGYTIASKVPERCN